MESISQNSDLLIPFRHLERNGHVVVSYGNIEDLVSKQGLVP